MTPAPGPWARRAWIVALPVVALAARGHLLGEKNLWWDEALAIWAVRKPLVETTLWTAGDVHPPLYFWMLWGWIRLVGQSEFAARYLSAMIGVAAAILAFAIARRLGGRRAGALALAFASLARFQIWWSMELRMYVLAGAAVALAVYAASRWLLLGAASPATPSPGRGDGISGPVRAPRELAWLAAYVLGATAALYTVYLSAVAVAVPAIAVAVHEALRRPSGETGAAVRRRRLRDWILAQLLVMALFAPWLALALPRMQSWSAPRGAPASAAFVSRLWATLVATGASTDLQRWAWWAVLFWSCVAIVPAALWLAGLGREADRAPGADGTTRASSRASGAGRADRRSARRVAVFGVLVPLAVAAPLAVWAATQPRSLFYSPSVEARYFVPFAVPLYALAGVGVAYASRRSQALGAILAIAALGTLLATLPGQYADRRLRDELQSMVLAIWSQAEDGDAVLLTSGNRYPLFLVPYGRPWDAEQGELAYAWPDLRPPRWEARPPVIPFPSRGSETVSEVRWEDRLSALAADHPRLWLAEVDAHLQDPGGDVEAWLNAHLPKVLSEAYGPNALHLYAADGAAPRVTGVSSRWPGVVAAEDPPSHGYAPVVGLPARRLASGDFLGLTMWHVDAQSNPPSEPWLTLGRDDGGAAPYLVSPPAAPMGARTALRARVVVQVDGRTPTGRHVARVEPGDGDRSVGSAEVLGRSPALSEGESVDAYFGHARLREVATSTSAARPGDEVVVDLTWVMGPTARVGDVAPSGSPGGQNMAAPVVFAHLVGPPRPDTGDPTWAVQDGPPSSGAWPARSGAQVFDRHVLAIDPAAPPGIYTLEVGLYDPATMERYPVRGRDADEGERRVVIGRVEVRR